MELQNTPLFSASSCIQENDGRGDNLAAAGSTHGGQRGSINHPTTGTGDVGASIFPLIRVSHQRLRRYRRLNLQRVPAYASQHTAKHAGVALRAVHPAFSATYAPSRRPLVRNPFSLQFLTRQNDPPRRSFYLTRSRQARGEKRGHYLTPPHRRSIEIMSLPCTPGVSGFVLNPEFSRHDLLRQRQWLNLQGVPALPSSPIPRRA